MKKLVIILMIVCIAAAASAGSKPFGVRGGMATSPDQVFVGGQMKIHEISPEMSIVPNVEYGFGDDWTIISLNAALHYAFPSSNMNGFRPYVGGEAGINIISFDMPEYSFGGVTYGGDSESESKFVINAVGGISKKMDAKKELFFEVKLGLSDYANDLKILAGLNFF